MEDGPPAFPPGFTCPAVLWILLAVISFRIRDCHSLWSAFPCSSPNLLHTHYSPNPFCISTKGTTCGISVDFFSSPYLDVSVQAVPLIYLCIQYMMSGHDSRRIAPFGNLRINVCLRLPAAYRCLLRPSSALSAKAFPLRSL